MVSTQCQQKKNQAKTATRAKKKKKFNPFFTTVSAITVQKECKNCDMLNINKNKEENNTIAPELDMLLKAIIFLMSKTKTKTMSWKPWLESPIVMETSN